jgi:hypothetical protein
MTVNKEQTLQETELGDSVVGRVDGLEALLTGNTDSDVGSLFQLSALL